MRGGCHWRLDFAHSRAGGESAQAKAAKTQNASATIRKMDEDMAGEFYHKATLAG